MQATAALKACQGSLERAADWLFSHAADLETSVNEVLQPTSKAPAAGKEGRRKLQDLITVKTFSDLCRAAGQSFEPAKTRRYFTLGTVAPSSVLS